MATSGSVDFNQTRNEIITDAYQYIGIYGPSDTISNEDLVFANRILNRMVKAWEAQGIHLWTQTEATLYMPVTGVQSYTLSSTGADASDTVVETTLSADEALGQTELSVTSSAGMTASDVCIIVLDDGTTEDTTIASVDSSTQITVDDALTSAAASGNLVFTYTTKINPPLKIDSVRVRDSIDNDLTLEEKSRQEYFDIHDKDLEGTPQFYYMDKQRDNSVLYIWPTNDDVTNRLKLTYRRRLEDFDSAADNPDFPQEWLEALVLSLALRLAPAFGKDAKAIQTIGPMATAAVDKMLEYDTESGSLRMIPDTEL